MTDKEIINEFTRWINTGKPSIWVKSKANSTEWSKQTIACWSQPDIMCYIIDDEQAELRKLQINEPDTKFQVKSKNGKTWIDIESEEDLWQPFLQYRVKPKEWYEREESIGKIVWVRDDDCEEWQLDIFQKYVKEEVVSFKCKFNYWIQAKPVKPEECYIKDKE